MRDYPVAYAAINNDIEIRNHSSSGGIFFLIAKYVIEQGGVVFGAKYNDNWEVEHGFADNVNDVKSFLGSKYVQSSLGDAYSKVKSFLKDDRIVLFSGTPCQIYGLKAFLGKKYSNLVTVDLICHGVPSRLVWRKYLEYRSAGRKIVNVNFRDKTEGWLEFSLKIDFKNGSFYRENQHEDAYMRGFLQDIYLRPACYECKFKGLERDTDITLADLWGCSEIYPEMFDNRGASLVLVQSVKGAQLWNSIKTKMNFCEIRDERYQKFNPNIMTPVALNKKRGKFYKNTSIENMQKLTKPAGIVRKLLRKSKRIAKKVLIRSE